MPLIFSNGPSRDYVKNPFNNLLTQADTLFLAAPYFTEHSDIVAAARAGKHVDLIIGLNPATSPAAVRAVLAESQISVRYFTSRFHAKIYLSDKGGLLGSANLTDGGLLSNREAVCVFDPEEDGEKIDELRALFAELWDSAAVLTDDVAQRFSAAMRSIQSQLFNPDAEIVQALGVVEPVNISVSSKKRSKKRLFLDDLQRRIYEQYRPSFLEVNEFLGDGYRRPELKSIGPHNETNRFLNWVRLEKAPSEEWQSAPLLMRRADRDGKLKTLGKEWCRTDNSRVPKNFETWLSIVADSFGDKNRLAGASKEQLTQGVLSLHAFTEQLRFVKGGQKQLPIEFWQENNNDVDRVRSTLLHLIYGAGDFVNRLHDTLYDPQYKLRLFGIFCCLELMGTVRPDICPPVNGRIAKALRFIGFDVRAS